MSPGRRTKPRVMQTKGDLLTPFVARAHPLDLKRARINVKTSRTQRVVQLRAGRFPGQF